jgi:hypothetical protein
MGKGTIERFGLKAIADALDGSDVATARKNLSQLVNSAVEVSGTVLKRVKRDGQCKLVIEPGASVPGFVVFADCLKDAETVTNSKIRKGSLVSVRGKFQTFGASAVCLSDCRLQQVATQKKGSSDKFGLKKRELENLSKPIISGAKNERQTRDKRERDETETKQRREAKAEIKQRQNKERTKKRGAFVP